MPLRPETPPKTIRLHQEILFGSDGNDAPYLGAGWAPPAPGHRMLGAAADIRMIHPGRGHLLLEIETVRQPGGSAGARRLAVEVNGVLAGTLDLPEQGRRALHIAPGTVPPGEIMAVRVASSGPDTAIGRLSLFTLRDSPRLRRAGGHSRDSAGLPPASLGRFLGVGDSPAFAQAVGAGEAGLPPSTAIDIPNLLRALDAGFSGLGEPETFEARPPLLLAPEWALFDHTYSAGFRVGAAAEADLRAAILERQGAHLRETRQALMRVLTAGGNIAVVFRGAALPPLTEQEALPLLIALNRHAPHHLLWISLADASHPPGTVEQAVPFLLHGWIDRLEPAPAGLPPSSGAWPELCANALAIADATAAAEPAGPAAKPQMPAAIAAAPAPPPAAQSGAAPEQPYALIQHLSFGADGEEEAALGFGWSGAEAGFRWTEGDSCELWLDHPGRRDVFVAIEAWPFVHPPSLPAQRVDVRAHDVPLGSLIFLDRARLAFHVHGASLRPGRIMRLRCALPDAARPSGIMESDDHRQLALSFISVAVHAAPAEARNRRPGTGGIGMQDVQDRTGQSAAAFLGQFESLGEGPALADLQDAFEAESQGIFGRAAIRLLDLVHAIETGFDGLGDPARLQALPCTEPPGHVELHDTAAGLSYVAAGQAGERVIAREARRLRFLRDKLLADMAAGGKIFVYHALHDASMDSSNAEAAMLPLLIALRRHGPCTLLYGVPADDANPPGTTEQSYPGLIRGYLADGGSHQASWLEICLNALQISGGDMGL